MKQEPRKPWITSEILEERKRRIELYQVYLDDKSDASFQSFKKQRNLVNKLCCKAMAEYYDQKFSNSKGNMKENWKLIKEVTGGNADTGGDEVQLEGFAREDKRGIVRVDQLKVAKVIPLHKGDPKKEIENWKPISILPLFSKLLEKVVHNRLYGFLQSNSLLSETQFGFRKGHSMTNALQHLVESVNSGINRGETPLSIFIDIRKAFDTVDFQTLISRLESLGVRGKCMKWFESYLTGRSLKVVLSDVNSAAFPVICGAPKGSVLGPLLYLIHVDLMRFYLKDVCLTSFADDTVLTVFASSVEELVRKANFALERLEVFTS